MYRFALEMTPEDTEAVATLLYVEMLEHGYTRVSGNSIICITTAMARPTPTLRR